MAQEYDFVLMSVCNDIETHLLVCPCGHSLGQVSTGEWFVLFHERGGQAGIVADLQVCEACLEERIVICSYPSKKRVEAAICHFVYELTTERIRANEERRVPALPFPLEHRLPTSLLKYMKKEITRARGLEKPR